MALPPTSCVSWGKLLPISGLSSSYLWIGDRMSSLMSVLATEDATWQRSSISTRMLLFIGNRNINLNWLKQYKSTLPPNV